jgi:hypothetical protein
MPYEGKSNSTYNRIVIVGNGYDLALGLQSSYKDFLLFYLKNSIVEAFDQPYKDRFIEIKKINYANNNQIRDVVNDINSFEKLREFCSENNRIPINVKHSLYSQVVQAVQLQNWVKHYTSTF